MHLFEKCKTGQKKKKKNKRKKTFHGQLEICRAM